MKDCQKIKPLNKFFRIFTHIAGKFPTFYIFAYYLFSIIMTTSADVALDIVKLTLPAGLVLYGMFLTAKSFLAKDYDKKILELKLKHFDTTIQLRLQAYERMALFLERITPSQLLPRVNDNEMSVAEFHAFLLNEVKQEYIYNLSQQIYISDATWQKIKSSVENLTSAINDVAAELDQNAPSIELARKLVEVIITSGTDFTGEALLALKQEAQTMFG